MDYSADDASVSLRAEPSIASRIDAIGWSLFAVMMLALGLMPRGALPQSTWLLGVSIIMLGGNGLRHYYKQPLVKWTLVGGTGALAAGVTGHFGHSVSLIALVVASGAAAVAIPVLRRLKSSEPNSARQPDAGTEL